MTIKQREFKIVFSLIGFYIFLLIGLTTPLVLAFYEFNGLGMQYKIIAPAISVIFVSWFHNSASDLLRNTASFAIPGVYELRQKYLPHVNRIKRVWLWLAIWAVIFSAL